MAEIVQRACAGTMESSDVYVEIEPGREGIQLHLESVVRQQFGEAIRETVRAVLAELSVYFAFIVAAMVAVTMLSVTKFAKQVVGQLLLTADYVRLAGQLGWIALGLGAAFMLLAYGVSRSVFRKNIASCIRFAE